VKKRVMLEGMMQQKGGRSSDGRSCG